MMKRRRLFKQESKSLDERYFTEIRPRLYELHSEHQQHGTRTGRTLAEHLDSACQFVLTVSSIAQVPDEKRGCILAATAVHDLNKLDDRGRNVKTLARDRAFLEEQLDRAGVRSLVKTDEDLELVRKLIERHSGHNVSDGTRFLPEDPNIATWAAMLIGGDLFDLGIEEDKRIRKVENELTVAFGRPSHLFKITLSEDRGYLTALLLSSCEEVLHDYGLNTLSINPDSQIFEGSAFPDKDLTVEIAKKWQKRIDRVFSSNVEQLVKATKDGIKVDPQAIQQNPEGSLDRVDFELSKKFRGYKSDKVAKDIEKYSADAGEDAVLTAQNLGLLPVSNDKEFAVSEGLKAAYLSYREAELSPKDAWDRIATHAGICPEQRNALEPFNAQYGRSLFAAKAVTGGIETVHTILQDSFQLRQSDDANHVSEELILAVRRLLNLTRNTKWQGFSELVAYSEANPRQRCSLGAMTAEVDELISNKMPPGTKVQAFSNRLPGGMSAEPKRRGDTLSSLAYQLLKVGANFPNASKQDPLYLHFALPQGSSPAIQAMWRKWMRDTAATNAEGGTVTFDELRLYRDGELTFKENKVVGLALPKRPEFSYSTVTIPVVWGDANNSVALLKSLRLALEISLALDVQFPFILSTNLEVEPDWDVFGRVEGIPSSLQPLLGDGIYYQQELASNKESTISVTAEQVLERLQYIGKLAVSVASLQKKDDCLYDLARAVCKPLSLYHVLLRWILREKDEANLDFVLDEIRPNLSNLMELIMSESDKVVSQYLREAAQIACEGKLWGNLRRRTGRSEPFSAFLKAIRSCKQPLDWDAVFPSLINQYHTRLDRIREHGVGSPKYEYIERYYKVLENLFRKAYQSKPERILSHSKDLEAAYLHFLREEYQDMYPKNENEE